MVDHDNLTHLHYHEVNLTNSFYNTKCYLKHGEGLFSNQTEYVYSPLHSNIAATGAVVISFLGFSLNSLVIAGLLNDKMIRKEVFTPFIISLALTDALFSILGLPVKATIFFLRCV